MTAFLLHKRRYGTRRLVSELADEGIQVGRQTVRTVLAEHIHGGFQRGRWNGHRGLRLWSRCSFRLWNRSRSPEDHL
ncbi:IS3 family transposase [Neolewinella antarctica]|uniref:IS3 family transposase n=1 Tax=Neolewinella antarctica TaxID=442734 RepID=UPI0038732811